MQHSEKGDSSGALVCALTIAYEDYRFDSWLEQWSFFVTENTVLNISFILF